MECATSRRTKLNDHKDDHKENDNGRKMSEERLRTRIMTLTIESLREVRDVDGDIPFEREWTRR